MNSVPSAQPVAAPVVAGSPQAVAVPQPTAPQPAVLQPEPNPAPAVQPQASPAIATVQASPPPAVPQPQGAYAVPKQQSSGMSITSMVLGIFSIVLSFIWFLAWPLAIAALVLGFIGRSKGGNGMAIAGIITGIVGLVISILIIILVVSNPETFPVEETSGADKLLVPSFLLND